MICSCFKEKDALNPPGGVENANAVECSEHLDFLSHFAFSQAGIPGLFYMLHQDWNRKRKKIEERVLQNKAGFYHLYTFYMESRSHF